MAQVKGCCQLVNALPTYDHSGVEGEVRRAMEEGLGTPRKSEDTDAAVADDEEQE
ncbi:MAG: hypothetical protein ACLQIB_33345 [Isosphaeraceae bacterium]